MTMAPASVATWQRLAQEGDLAAAILAYVRAHDGTTLATLQHIFDPYMDVWGAMDLGPCDESVVYWQGMSPQFVELLCALLARGLLYGLAVSPRRYCAEGQALPHPLARRLPRGGYKGMHWLPITLHAGS